jgi:hypothetical protein
MAIGFDENTPEDHKAFYLVAHLAMEAGVGLTGEPYQPVQLQDASWDVENGLVVRDWEGNLWRLKVTAQALQERED